ncbi:hypothetical protein niasHT_024576 [Heterodera trifolii]|uniref:Uncharacterized protein n=1 Tax=Heterodera trifolii TaxID=157864 RepID=A0ABD2K7E5_9BILA
MEQALTEHIRSLADFSAQQRADATRTWRRLAHYIIVHMKIGYGTREAAESAAANHRSGQRQSLVSSSAAARSLTASLPPLLGCVVQQQQQQQQQQQHKVARGRGGVTHSLAFPVGDQFHPIPPNLFPFLILVLALTHSTHFHSSSSNSSVFPFLITSPSPILLNIAS